MRKKSEVVRLRGKRVVWLDGGLHLLITYLIAIKEMSQSTSVEYLSEFFSQL